jgi:energy-coupling factor transport system permease protein
VTRFSTKTKILLYIFLLIAVFLSDSLEIDILILLLVLPFTWGIPLSKLKRGMIPILLFLGFTFFSNVLFQTGRVVYEISGLTITEEGLRRGLHLTLRLFILILGAKILVATSTAEDLITSVTILLGPLGRWRPVKEFVLTMSLTIRLLPIIYDEAISFYKESFKNSSDRAFLDRMRLAVSLLSPLFERSIKRARDLTIK